MNSKSKTPHIAMLPTPGMGHLIPITELAKRLVHHHDFSITIIYFSESNSKAQQSFLNSLPPSITSISLPPVNLDHLPPNAIETRMSVASSSSVPSILTILQCLKLEHNLVAYIADVFGADTFDAAKDANIPSFLFFSSNFLALSLLLNLKKLDDEIKCEFKDLESPLKLPGCVPIPGKDVLCTVQNKKDEAYAWMVHHGEKYKEAEGILVNTFGELEPEAAKAQTPPVYAVGPLVRTGSGDRPDPEKCLQWLDKQPRGSVIFVSFGSAGTLSTEQTRELALGLEMSGQRFLWVVRSPNDCVSANYFDSESERDPLEYLPEGFVGRCSGVGMVVRSWAPQMEVLGHEAVGGFLTHCGWNSILESVVSGVPMIGWPLFAEQRQNAVMLVEGVRVAIRVMFGSDGVVRKEGVSDVVKELMEGEEGKRVRYKVEELRLVGIKALEEEGKSSRNLKELVHKWNTFGGIV